MSSKKIAFCYALVCGLVVFGLALYSGQFDWQAQLQHPTGFDLMMVKLFGPYIGLRVIIFLLGIAGFLSCYWWLKTPFGEQAALVAATAWTLHVGVLWKIAVGSPILLWILLLPLFLNLTHTMIVRTSVRHTLWLGALSGVMLLGKSEYVFSRLILPAILLWAGVLIVRQYTTLPKAKLVASGALWLLIVALITVPRWPMWLQPTDIALAIDDGTIAFNTVISHLWLSRAAGENLPVAGDFMQAVYGTWEVNVALGVVASCLALIGLAIGWRKKFNQTNYYIYAWILLIVGVVLASNLEIWTTLDQFFDRRLNMAPRLLELSSFGLVIVVACGTQWLLSRMKKYQWPITVAFTVGILLEAGIWMYQAARTLLVPIAQGQAAAMNTIVGDLFLPSQWLTVNSLVSIATILGCGLLLYKNNSAALQRRLDQIRIKPFHWTITDDVLKIITILLLCSGVIGIQLMLLPNFGTLDMGSFVEVVEALDSRGLLAGYSYKNLYYPPLASVALYPLTWFPIGAFAIKCLIAVFYYAVLVMILCYMRVLKKQSWLQSLRTVLLILCNVALIESTFVLGYIDIFIVPALLLAFYSMARKRYFWAGAALAVAFMTKLLPILLIPAFLIWFYKRWKDLAIFCLGMAIVVVPQLIIFDQVALSNVIAISNSHGLIPSYAFNVNQIVALFSDQATTSVQMYYIGRIIFLGSVALLLRALVQSKQSIIQFCYTCTGIFLAYFVWFSGVHENHLFPALIPMLALVVVQPNARNWLWYHVITLLVFFNLFIPYGFGLFEEYYGLTHFWLFSDVQWHTIKIALSLTSIVAYLAFMWQATRTPEKATHQ